MCYRSNKISFCGSGAQQDADIRWWPLRMTPLHHPPNHLPHVDHFRLAICSASFSKARTRYHHLLPRRRKKKRWNNNRVSRMWWQATNTWSERSSSLLFVDLKHFFFSENLRRKRAVYAEPNRRVLMWFKFISNAPNALPVGTYSTSPAGQ